MLELASAEYVDGYRIRICFDDGECGIVDLKDILWGPMFEPLRDIDTFRRFEISETLHTIRWENDADLAPEFLYDMMVEQTAARSR
jgi:hypothetical protein